jgi:catechol 2,3-dioxygenase-like lactoylglutathione lyase family enzyme
MPLAMLSRKFMGRGLCHSRCRGPSFCWREHCPGGTERNLMARLKQTGQDYQCEPTSFSQSTPVADWLCHCRECTAELRSRPHSSVVIAPDGTVHVTRVIPLPSTISAAARENLVKMKPADQSHQTLQEHRTETDKWQAERAKNRSSFIQQLYFRDPDGHMIEFIALLDENPDSEFIGSLSEWQRRTGQSRG